jgi:hypothetical protein
MNTKENLNFIAVKKSSSLLQNSLINCAIKSVWVCFRGTIPQEIF